MKKLIKLNVLFILIMMGCQGLDPEVIGTLNPSSFPKTSKEYEAYAMEVYVPFSSKWPYNETAGVETYHFFGLEEGHIQLYDAPSDLLTEFTEWGDGGAYWQSKSRGYFVNMIGAARNRSHFEKVRFVTRTTQIIDDLQKATVFTDENFRNQLIGEVKMARAWAMYFMLHLFGPVPVILDPTKIGNAQAEADLSRPSRTDYVNSIAADLRFAADNLPKSASNYGRFNKGIALTVLMRLYMNERDFQKAEPIGREIKALGYDLVSDYMSLFREATEVNNETIYAISCDGASQGRSGDGNFNAYTYYTLPSDFTSHAGWASPNAVFMATWDFYDSFNPADKRRQMLVASYGTRDRTNLRGAVINKYPAEGTGAYQGNDIVLARYADVLLMLAEAINENNAGPTAEAIGFVNYVRQKHGGISDLAAADTGSKQAFNTAILRERGWDLFFEGLRKFDLQRHGKWPTAVAAVTNKTPGPYLLPIPQYALTDSKGSLLQNEGY